MVCACAVHWGRSGRFITTKNPIYERKWEISSRPDFSPLYPHTYMIFIALLYAHQVVLEQITTSVPLATLNHHVYVTFILDFGSDSYVFNHFQPFSVLR